jgi:phosphoglycolate phosphatase
VTIRLAVFDLDGTLVDSHRDLADATNALLVDLGAEPLPVDAITRMVGDGAAVLVRRALTAAGLDPEWPDALAGFLVRYDERLLVHTRPYAGIPETLAALQPSAALAVLTNKPTRATTTILEGLGLAPYFERVIGGDTAFGRKPDPAGLRHLMEAAGVMPDATVLIGDSPVDRETARRAGSHICLARYGFGYTFSEEDLAGDEMVVDGPEEIVERILTRTAS